jgi:hypothetical protein
VDEWWGGMDESDISVENDAKMHEKLMKNRRKID